MSSGWNSRGIIPSAAWPALSSGRRPARFRSGSGGEIVRFRELECPARHACAAHGLTAHDLQERRKSSMPGDSAVQAPMTRSSWFALDSSVHTRPRTPGAPARVALAAARSRAASGPAMPLTGFSADWRGCKPPRRRLHRQRFNPARDPFRSRRPADCGPIRGAEGGACLRAERRSSRRSARGEVDRR